MEPFYFKSYDKVIGVAYNVKELEKEVEKLSKEDPAALQYHLKEGHIVSWLNYLGENGLAEMLKGVTEPEEALARIKEYELLKNSTQMLNKTTSSKKEKKRKAFYYY